MADRPGRKQALATGRWVKIMALALVCTGSDSQINNPPVREVGLEAVKVNLATAFAEKHRHEVELRKTAEEQDGEGHNYAVGLEHLNRIITGQRDDEIPHSGALSQGTAKPRSKSRLLFPTPDQIRSSITGLARENLGVYVPDNLPTTGDFAARVYKRAVDVPSTQDVLVGGIRSTADMINGAKKTYQDSMNHIQERNIDDEPVDPKKGFLFPQTTMTNSKGAFNAANLAMDGVGAAAFGPAGLLPAAYRVIGTQDWINADNAVNLLPFAALPLTGF